MATCQENTSGQNTSGQDQNTTGQVRCASWPHIKRILMVRILVARIIMVSILVVRIIMVRIHVVRIIIFIILMVKIRILIPGRLSMPDLGVHCGPLSEEY